MKLLAITLSFFIILISTASIKDALDFNCSENSCGSSTEQHQNPSEKNNDCDKDCCLCITCCHYFVALSHCESICTPFVYINNDFYNSSEADYSNVFFDVWNPPKQV